MRVLRLAVAFQSSRINFTYNQWINTLEQKLDAETIFWQLLILRSFRKFNLAALFRFTKPFKTVNQQISFQQRVRCLTKENLAKEISNRSVYLGQLIRTFAPCPKLLPRQNTRPFTCFTRWRWLTVDEEVRSNFRKCIPEVSLGYDMEDHKQQYCFCEIPLHHLMLNSEEGWTMKKGLLNCCWFIELIHFHFLSVSENSWTIIGLLRTKNSRYQSMQYGTNVFHILSLPLFGITPKTSGTNSEKYDSRKGIKLI